MQALKGVNEITNGEKPMASNVTRIHPKVVDDPNKGFPKSRKQAKRRLSNVRKEFCDGVLQDVIENAMRQMAAYGVSPEIPDENTMKRHVFLVEAAQAYLYHKAGVPHPFDKFIEENIIGPSEQNKA